MPNAGTLPPLGNYRKPAGQSLQSILKTVGVSAWHKSYGQRMLTAKWKCGGGETPDHRHFQECRYVKSCGCSCILHESENVRYAFISIRDSNMIRIAG